MIDRDAQLRQVLADQPNRPSQPTMQAQPQPQPQKWPPSSNARRVKERHLWTRQQLESSLPAFERGVAVVLWILNTTGSMMFLFTILQMVGVGWWVSFGIAIGVGLIIQTLLTFTQFAYARHHRAVAYFSRAIDAAFSTGGWLWIAVWFELILRLALPSDIAYWASYAVLIGLSFFIAWYPEHVAVKETQ